jgi:hypothetical protein
MLGIFNTSGKRKHRHKKNNQNGSHPHFALLTKTDALEWSRGDFPGESTCEKKRIFYYPSSIAILNRYFYIRLHCDK